jgi:hypothetical protein
MTALTPVETSIVLVGGGHAHVHVLSAFAKLPEPGVRLTLVTRDLATPYSGMLPGVVAGLYSVDEASRRMGPLRMTGTAQPPVLEVVPCSRNSSFIIAAQAVATIGKCIGRQPAITALIASFSAVIGTSFGYVPKVQVRRQDGC